jgi:hypothetical protein
MAIVTTLCIPHQQTLIDSNPRPAPITYLVDILADTKRLEHLTIHVDMLARNWLAFIKSEETVHASLEKTLSPFRAIRGLSKINTVIGVAIEDPDENLERP